MSTIRRPHIFIASSAEALDVARAVKNNFDHEADVDIWNEGIFNLNRSYLDTLLNRASYYDFFIAVFTPDDEAKIRKEAVRISRGNVIFEFGLFLGRLGPDRAFLIIQEGVDMFSDWNGIEVAKFHLRDNLTSAVGNACNRIREEMKIADKRQHFSMLPSTSLAIGYYTNFLSKVFDAFEYSVEYKIIQRNNLGTITSETTHKIADRHPSIHVMMPRDLNDLQPNSLRRRTANYSQIVINTRFRDFPFYISAEEAEGASPVLFDIPTTMLSSKIAIERIFSEDFLNRENNRRHLEDREISNFERTLRIMVPDELERKYFDFSILE